MTLDMKGYILLSLMFITSNGYSASQDVDDVHDLCRYNRYMDDRYMDENSRFQLNIRSAAKSDSNDKLVLQKHKSKCSLAFKLCSSCHMTILIQNMDIPSCSHDCSCNYFVIREPLSDYASQKYCGERSWKDIYFESLTKVVHFDFVQSVHKTFYVSLTVNVSRNVYFFMENSNSLPRYIETPHFPAKYPSDYTADYHFQAFRPNGYVQLVFIDFWLSQWSYVEVSGHNGTLSEVFYGDKFRPPTIVSDGPLLSLKFVANEQIPKHGFRAIYTFHKKENGVLPSSPNTVCGGPKQDEFGVLQLAVPQSTTNKELFDCIWVINPSLFVGTSQFISVSVTNYGNIGKGSSIEFRKGLTSKSALMFLCKDLITCGLDMLNNELITAAHTGIYVRFQGHVDKDSSITIYYYTFRENNCTTEEHACSDGKCVSPSLICDGHYHCADGADEKDCSNRTEATLLPTTTVLSVAPSLGSPTKEKFMFQNSTEFMIFTVIGVSGIIIFVISVLLVIYTHVKDRIQDEDYYLEEVVETPEDVDVPQRIITPRLHRYRLPFRDHPPSYEHVINFDEMYPPLFYTRSSNRAETCMNQGLPPISVDLQGSLPSLHRNIASYPSQSEGDDVVINLSAISRECRSSGSTLYPMRLKKSLSIDSALDKLQYAAPSYSCHVLPAAENPLLDASRPGCSVGMKSGEVQLNYQAANFDGEHTVRCSFQTRMSQDMGIVLALEHRSVPSTPFRKKTSSF